MNSMSRETGEMAPTNQRQEELLAEFREIAPRLDELHARSRVPDSLHERFGDAPFSEAEAQELNRLARRWQQLTWEWIEATNLDAGSA